MNPANKQIDTVALARRLRIIAGTISVKGPDVLAMASVLQGLEQMENALIEQNQDKKDEI